MSDKLLVTKMLNTIFKSSGNVISANMLRHSYITWFHEQYTGTPALVEMEALAFAMAHSLETN